MRRLRRVLLSLMTSPEIDSLSFEADTALNQRGSMIYSPNIPSPFISSFQEPCEFMLNRPFARNIGPKLSQSQSHDQSMSRVREGLCIRHSFLLQREVSACCHDNRHRKCFRAPCIATPLSSVFPIQRSRCIKQFGRFWRGAVRPSLLVVHFRPYGSSHGASAR